MARSRRTVLPRADGLGSRADPSRRSAGLDRQLGLGGRPAARGRLGDGWLASAYNTTPEQVAGGRDTLRDALVDQPGRVITCAVATMWTWVTDDEHEWTEWLTRLSVMLNRPEQDLAGRLQVGPAERCAELLRAYAAAGVDLLLVWPLADHERQLERVMQEVVPLVQRATGR
jgi:alkanesulfonate monooxygenase SsuD/methylene tetrahydromethanopterin reductase-like flavin-dependent oxidoreductase (luciferase family)